MHHELEVVADPDAVAGTAAAFVAGLALACVQAHGRFTFAASGGHTPWAMFARLAHEDVPWEHVTVFQADERVAPDGDPDRNLTHLRESLGAAPAEVIATPVNDADPDAAAAAYGQCEPLSRLVAGDRSIPRVKAAASLVLADAAAAGRGPTRVGAQPPAGP
ncbi:MULTISPECIES: 6-phosphogluconolactonase [unclassified Streptomyces]|uniref:6-phosphogluconolactonase n=1 Tax=unclassified Streptomyces TaxID=2593676 RepID=UPI0036E7A0BE